MRKRTAVAWDQKYPVTHKAIRHVRKLNIFFIILWAQRHGSGSTHGSSVYLRSEGRPSISDNLWVVVWTRLLDRKSSFLGCISRGRRGKSKNRPKNRISGLVEPISAVFRPYFHVFSRRGGLSRPLRVFCSDNWVSPLPSIIFRNPIILSSWVQRQRSPSRHLWRVMVERLVGFHFHWLFLASLSEIVAARSMLFPLTVWKVH